MNFNSALMMCIFAVQARKLYARCILKLFQTMFVVVFFHRTEIVGGKKFMKLIILEMKEMQWKK